MRSQHVLEDYKIKSRPLELTARSPLWASHPSKHSPGRDSKIKSCPGLGEQGFQASSRRLRVKPVIGITLVFTSSIDKNIRISLHLLKAALINMTSQIISLRQVVWPEPFSRNAPRGEDKGLEKLGEFCQVPDLKSPPLQGHSALVKREVVKVLRASRFLNAPLKPTSIPQPVKLFTVIKSPHVFKKTREQFASNLSKRALQVNFRDRSTAQLFLESLILLKLPVETKVFLKDYGEFL